MKECATPSTLTPCMRPLTPPWVWVTSSSEETSITVTCIWYFKVFATYLLNDRSAYRDPHLPLWPDDLSQQWLGECTEGRNEALHRGAAHHRRHDVQPGLLPALQVSEYCLRIVRNNKQSLFLGSRTWRRLCWTGTGAPRLMRWSTPGGMARWAAGAGTLSGEWGESDRMWWFTDTGL